MMAAAPGSSSPLSKRRWAKAVTFRFLRFRVGFRVLGTFWAIFGKISAWRARVKRCEACILVSRSGTDKREVGGSTPPRPIRHKKTSSDDVTQTSRGIVGTVLRDVFPLMAK